MKTYLQIGILALFALGSCTETIYDEVVKEIRDTIKVPVIDTVFIDRVFWKVDTVEIRTTITEVDTFFVATIDSVFIYETVYVHDTVYQHIHHYHDTAYIFPGRTVYYVPEEYREIVNQFFVDAVAYGYSPVGGNLLIEPWRQDEFPPASRSSFSYQVWSQFILKLKDTIEPKYCFTPIYRELMHWQFEKPYSTDPNSIMNPDFDWERLTLESEDKEVYLDELFAN